MKCKKLLRVLLLMFLVIAIMTGCKGSKAQPAREKISEERRETLFVTGVDWQPPPSFNLLSGAGGWPVNQLDNQILYETLFMYNSETDSLEPSLAESYEWTDPYTVVVKMTDKAYFRDGEPVTAHDFEWTVQAGWGEDAYTCQWNFYDDFFEHIKALDDFTIEAKLKQNKLNRFVMINMLMATPVMPMHVWKAIEKEHNGDKVAVQQLFMEDPIGSGPYRVDMFDDTRTALIRNENYWGVARYGKLPAPKKIVNLMTTNATGQIMFEKGDIDYTENFTTGFSDMIDKGLPVTSFIPDPPYMPNDSSVIIMINLQKPGLNNVHVRRALSMAIDYSKAAVVAMGGYSAIIEAGLYVNLDSEKSRVNMDAIKDLQWKYDPDAANKLLDEIGAVRGEDGIRVLPDGTRLGPWRIECPAGWSDWNAGCEIFAQSARKIGIEIRTEFGDYSSYLDSRQLGEFDFLIDNYGQTLRTGNWWRRARETMYDIGVPPVGEVAFFNFARYKNKRATEILDAIPALTDKAKIKQLYTELNQIYLEDVVNIPIFYRPIHFAFMNETVWTNYPVKKDGYQPYLFNGAGIRGLYKMSAKM